MKSALTIDNNFCINLKGYIAAFLVFRESIILHKTNNTLRNPSGGRGNSYNVPVARYLCYRLPDVNIVSSAPGHLRRIAV